MINLIKIEFYKMFKGKEKYIIITALAYMLFSSIVRALNIEESYNYSFFDYFYLLFDMNFQLFMPLSLGIFAMSMIHIEFKDKFIKNYFISNYSKISIYFSKIFSIIIFSTFSYSVMFIIYSIISYNLSRDIPIIYNYLEISNFQLILHLVTILFMSSFYIIAIVIFTTMLVYVTRKLSISVFIFIFLNTFLIFLFEGMYDIVIFPRLTFLYASQLFTQIGSIGFGIDKIKYILPCIFNIFLFIPISLITFDKYDY